MARHYPPGAPAVWNVVGAILNGRGWHAGVVSARKSFMFLAARAPASLFAGLPRLTEDALEEYREYEDRNM